MSELASFLKSRKKVNLGMVIGNVLVYIILCFIGDPEDPAFLLKWGAAYPPAILAGEPYRLVTSLFLHFGFYHLAYNMLSLIFMGDILEGFVGPVSYLAIYLLGGIGGNLLSLAHSLGSGTNVIAAGASGAIFSVIGGLFCIALRNRSAFGQRNMKKLSLVILLMIMQGAIDQGVDGYAHLGGLISGFLLTLILYRKNRRTHHERL